MDVIISTGYRVKSKRGTQFRIWATNILKEFLLKGHAIHQRIERVEKKINEHEQKFDLLIRTNLPPTEGIFFDGQVFDAFQFVSGLIKSAKKSIHLIDNYIDETVLVMLSKGKVAVKINIYTQKTNDKLKLDLEKFEIQYSKIAMHTFDKSHDRFLIIDESIVYHFGASLKDLGKKWFAFSKMEIPAKEILKRLS